MSSTRGVKRRKLEQQGSNLPGDLLLLISDRLDSRLDLPRFRAVCKSWRSSIPPMNNNNRKFNNEINLSVPFMNINHKITLIEITLYRFEDMNSKSWLVKVDNSKRNKSSILNLFPFGTHRVFPKKFNLLDYRVFEFGKTYKVKAVPKQDHGFRKVVISTDHSKLLAVSKLNRLAFFTLQDQRWTLSPYNFGDDFYNDKFYAISAYGKVLVIYLDTMETTQGLFNLSGGGPVERYLMQSCGDIYVVDPCLKDRLRSMFQSSRFKVYRLIESDCELVKVVNVRVQAVFVSEDYSFVVSEKQFAGFFEDGNWIYFTSKLDLFSLLWDISGCDSYL